ncbi:unnamed protein product [Phyllotreta striolata]|uniref:C2H2-type domain-containing protein n=1 Tax=Phyllotreta striolata TaxID=444603 RepID=A0A9N9XRG0_PHYSR|nr:unnamed protein product [Phyllotreta striolata]
MSDFNGSQLDKNFKIPTKKSAEMINDNVDYNSGNSMVSNSYYEYYNQYTQAQWQQSTAYPQQYYGDRAIIADPYQPVDPMTQNILTTLSNIKEKPKNVDKKNIFKDTVPDVDDPSLPKELTVLFQPLFCKLCTVKLSSNIMAKMHYKSKNHEKKIRKFLVEYAARTDTPVHPRAKNMAATKQEIDSDPKWFHCDACDLPLTGKMHAESHYMGRAHQRVIMGQKRPSGRGYYNEEGKWVRQEKMKRVASNDEEDTFGMDFKKAKTTEEEPLLASTSKPAVVPVQSKFHCSICNVGTTCQEQLEIHYGGQKHIKKLKELGIVGINPDASVKSSGDIDPDLSVYRTPSGEYYCPLCNITLSSGVHFKLHIKGKNHLKKAASQNSQTVHTNRLVKM